MSSLLERPYEIDAVIGRSTPGRIGLMLYGSHARGTATAGSDVDLLELVEAPPRAYSVGRCNVTQYTPRHLETLASNGSLFVRHLTSEGEILLDRSQVLSSILASYRAPTSYSNMLRQIEIAGGALDPRAADFAEWVDGLARLGLYLLRTSVYLSRAQSDIASFDLSIGLDAPLAKVLELRHRTRFTPTEVRRMYASLIELNPNTAVNQLGSVQAYIVANSTRQDLASLFAPVLGGTGTIDYGTLSLPPF